ncbi:hypothetical protein [Actinomadura sp. CNU-125]|uniref:hypothetical protein n=1 Tax=Actinomadura sp. CNU-125 TaxID=1904961 RepID=UPI0021CCA2CB|nr:hypothetical protein [Actinomadura sp. CNU-125]
MATLTPETAARIAEAAAAQLDEGRARLRAYALAESPSGDAAALARCADLVAAGQEAAGGRVRRVPSPAVTTWSRPSGRTAAGTCCSSATTTPCGRSAASPRCPTPTTGRPSPGRASST